MDVLEDGLHKRVVDGDNEHLTRALDLRVVDVSRNVRIGTGRAWILSVQYPSSFLKRGVMCLATLGQSRTSSG
jgi:hypothetical protein